MVPLPSDVVIRDAGPDEFDAVARLLAEAYEEYMPGDDAPPEMREAFADYREDIADVRGRAEEGAVAIVAEREGELLGAVTYYPPGKDETGEGWPGSFAAFRLLGVLPEGRGRAVGRALVDEVVRRARAHGATAIGLHTTELMKVARAMYERMGCVRVPEKDFYPTPDFQVAAYHLDL